MQSASTSVLFTGVHVYLTGILCKRQMSASMATGLLLGFKQGRRQGLQLDHRNRISPPRGAQAETVLGFPSGTQEQQEHDRRCGPQDSREEWKAVHLGSSIETETK